MKLLLRIAYDGRGYCGFQKQKNGISVQEKLTDTLSRSFGFPCTVTGCSRTDAGVHAYGFCAAVEPVEAQKRGEDWLRVPVEKVHRAMKQYLPEDIAVTGACLVPDDFHPRYSVVEKTYIYKLAMQPWHDPFLVGRAWETFVPFSSAWIQHMEEAGEYLVGRHNFASFMAAGSKITDPTRTVTALSVRQEGEGMAALRISADGFLYNMVRIITGTLWEFAKKGRPAEEMAAILAAQDRKAAGKTAPPEGLYLESVRYPSEYGIQWVCG